MSEMLNITMDDLSVKSLCKVDPELCKLIHVVGDFSIPLQGDFFEALVQKIIGQMLSVKVAATIGSRVKMLCPSLSPETINRVSDEELRSVGISKGKISYIRDLVIKVESGELNFNELASLKDEEVIKELMKVKGIGKWTAEMFLIFSLGRLNVFSYADVGLQRGIKWLYQINDDEIDFDCLFRRWSPYNTVASLYLWEIVNRDFIKDFQEVDELVERYMGRVD
jgi:DNA-3-methyladenine glycosylase II